MGRLCEIKYMLVTGLQLEHADKHVARPVLLQLCLSVSANKNIFYSKAAVIPGDRPHTYSLII